MYTHYNIVQVHIIVYSERYSFRQPLSDAFDTDSITSLAVFIIHTYMFTWHVKVACALERLIWLEGYNLILNKLYYVCLNIHSFSLN